MKLLADKNLLLRVYTQNVDGLETSAGIDPQLIVEVHGTLRRAKCANCGTPVPIESLESAVFAKCVLNCSICGGVIKPDVVFFGEQLPDRFFELLEDDCANCDMIIIAGTSLMVHPVSSIAQLVPTDIPRVLINKEKVGLFKQSSDCLYSPSISESSTSTDNYRSDPSFSSKPSLDETEDNNENMDLLIYDRDVTWLGNCDDGFKELSMYLGWRDELESLIKK
ncbi:NAD-dependent protein deacetylase sirtuin-2 [Thelohanellus kitauei]|uniref:NAD-dependent protein deacetylase sirtuin-2 n=1 Tax=Thelohanellus kitauei TaxID=669202 RepID=A0A0C2JB03_THEKT|nr:NAD-dependent protein deacetylase sirtuin-2 [Thelohanellus kitauei]